MKTPFLSAFFFFLSISLTSCHNVGKSSENVSNTSDEYADERQMDDNLSQMDQGQIFLTKLYDKINNDEDFNPYLFLTDRFAFATYECDWDIFLNAQDFPDEYSVSVDKYDKYENAYLVKIDGGKDTWFNSELVYILLKDNSQFYINNLMSLNGEDGLHWLADYTKEKKYQETIIFTPDKKTYANELQWLYGWGWQVREDIDNDSLEETCILNIEDEDLTISIRKKSKHYEIGRLKGFVKDDRDEYKLQLSFYDIDSDDYPEILFAYYDNDADSKLYIQKVVNLNGYASQTILDALDGRGKYIIDKDTITVPLQQQGLFEKYIYHEDGYSKQE